MKDKEKKMLGTLPKELSDPHTLKLFSEVAKQDRERGWALLFPADISEMGILNKLVGCGLISVDSGVRQFDLFGRAKSAEVICQLTETGKLACSALAV